MKKEKIHLEYLLNATSKNILWSAISTPTGLEDWFADKVVSDDKTFVGAKPNSVRPVLLRFGHIRSFVSTGLMTKMKGTILKLR